MINQFDALNIRMALLEKQIEKLIDTKRNPINIDKFIFASWLPTAIVCNERITFESAKADAKRIGTRLFTKEEAIFLWGNSARFAETIKGKVIWVTDSIDETDIPWKFSCEGETLIEDEDDPFATAVYLGASE